MLPLVALLAVLAAACSSASSPSAKAPAGAKENATSDTMCRDLYNGGQLACAENTIGPGGGVVFYDSVKATGSVQPWGRFLEVAPWNWNPTVSPSYSYTCQKDGGCGADTRSILHPMVDRTQDRTTFNPDTNESTDMLVTLCSHKNGFWGEYQPLGSAAAHTGESIGSGAAATAALLADPNCGAHGGWLGAVQLVNQYRGGGLADWFLPSKDELVALCKFGNRNGVGGFLGGDSYASSSTVSDDWTFWNVPFGDPSCTPSQQRAEFPILDTYNIYVVRPIRTFS